MFTYNVMHHLYLLEHIGKYSLDEISKILQISIKEICEFSDNFNLRKPPNRFLHFIKDNYEKIGIYIIKNLSNDRIYIGSSCNIGSRIKQHITDLNCNKHINKELQKDWKLNQFTTLIYKYYNTIEEAVGYEQNLIKTTENKYNKHYDLDYLSIIGSRKDKILRLLDKRIDKEYNCWLWTGKINKSDYGDHRITNNGEISTLAVHKTLWVLHNNKNVPSGMKLCHECDNKLCVNPKHLFIGTDQDNARDYQNKKILQT